jgi:hypothetical protein
MPIQRHATAIKIPHLVHFTRASNLPSIMAHGLYPVGRAHEVGATPEINDHERWDGHRDSTSISITFPNYKMFFGMRNEYPDVDWAVVVLDPSVLWTKQCAFSKFNAADGRISSQPIANLVTVQAFAGMFDPIPGHPTREEQRLLAHDTTDVQAEVLVFDVIEPSYFRGVAFNRAAVLVAYREYLGKVPTKLYSKGGGLFASRGYVR